MSAVASAPVLLPAALRGQQRRTASSRGPAPRQMRLRAQSEQGEAAQAAQTGASGAVEPPTAAAAAPAPAPASSSSPAAPEPSGGKGVLAGGAVGLGVALFLAGRLTLGGPSFAALEADAVPLDLALQNGKPSIVEFYAGEDAMEVL